MVFAGLYALAPNALDALKIVKPDTVIRWHRAGFRGYWRWKSRPRGGRPRTAADIRQLIREMSIANPLWGAPRIHGELLKLGIEVGQTTVAKYMAKRRRPPSRLEDLPLQSCRRHCLDRPVRGADGLVSAVVWIADPAAHPARAALVRGYRPSDGRVDRAAIYRGHRLARCPAVRGAGSRPGLRQRIHAIGRLRRVRPDRMDTRRG
jgi:hypothetical protein